MRSAKLLIGFSLIIPTLVLGQGGQSGGGAIAGTVMDPAGAVLAKATVQAKSVETGNVFKAVSMGTGKYKLADVPAGQYEITVAVPGLRPYQQKDVRVQAAKESVVDIHLQEGTQLSSLGEDNLAIVADMRRHAPPAGPTPRTADGKPDLSGVWWTPQVTDPGKPEWLPFAEKIARQQADNNRKDSPQARCLPSPIVRLGPLYEFVQSKAVLVLISDDDTPGFRQIYLDGRGHPEEPDPAWYGHAVGRWEGDTLVIDRVNFHEKVWLDQDGHPHTEKLHVIERYRRPDLGHLETDVTVEDPGILAKPWTFKRVSDLAAKEEIREFVCNENNPDLPHMVGK